jgi:DNA invertase Pin-like site-specific DNA recombinase
VLKEGDELFSESVIGKRLIGRGGCSEGSFPSSEWICSIGRKIFAALAEFERDILRQRANAGLKAARRRGRVDGRRKAFDEADLRKARALLRSGEYSKVQVADELEVSRHTLWRALSLEKTK